jgi:hypothetical protein
VDGVLAQSLRPCPLETAVKAEVIDLEDGSNICQYVSGIELQVQLATALVV